MDAVERAKSCHYEPQVTEPEGRCPGVRNLQQLLQRASDLAVPPGNRLEALRGNRAGFHSIRINDQWRLVFRWTESGPAEVAIMDYH